MRVKLLVLAFTISALALAVAAGGVAGSDKSHVKATLSGYNEVPTLSTSGHGRFEARIDDGAQTITYTLTYAGLSAPATAAHIHLGARATNGGVSAFLCGGGSKPACPAGTSSEATVTGTIVVSDVIGPSGQGIAPGEFDELVAAIRARVTYANVHSGVFPGGEIRGPLRARDD